VNQRARRPADPDFQPLLWKVTSRPHSARRSALRPAQGETPAGSFDLIGVGASPEPRAPARKARIKKCLTAESVL
jgi:hypothetical protein